MRDVMHVQTPHTKRPRDGAFSLSRRLLRGLALCLALFSLDVVVDEV